jgi:hypothetical protein
MAKSARFELSSARRVADATRRVEAGGTTIRERSVARAAPRRRHVGVARIDSNEGDGEYTVTVQRYSTESDSYQDVARPDGLIEATAYDYRGRAMGQTDWEVPFWEESDLDGAMLLMLDVARVGELFAVQVTNDGGSAGDSTTTCSYTYTVQDLSGTTTLGSSIAPKKWRHSSAQRKMQAPASGSIGLAYYDASGTLCLYDANEVPAVATCA